MNTKPYALSALIALILSSPLTVAAETEAATTQPCPVAAKTAEYPPEIQAMRDSFDKIRAARTPAEREQAIQEMQAAREASFKAMESQFANANPDAGMPPFPGAPAVDPAALAQYQAEQQKQAEAARAQYDAWVKASQEQQQQQAAAMSQYRAAQAQQAQAARAQYEAWVNAAQAQQAPGQAGPEQAGEAEREAMRAQHHARMQQRQAEMARQFPQQPGFAAYVDPRMQAQQEFHQKMQAYADKLAQARNPEEFQALLAEQRAFVQATRNPGQTAPVAYDRNHCGPRD